METYALFDTPLFVFRPRGLEAVDDALSARLIVESDREPGLQRSNYGGWHSDLDLAQRDDRAFRRLIDVQRAAVYQVLEAVGAAREVMVPVDLEMAMEIWAVVMRHGDYATLHDHSEAHFSTLYYPDAGESTGQSGGITFVDGRRGATTIPGFPIDPTEFNLCPESGMLLVFPGWLQHYVHPYLGECPRVSIGANVRFLKA